jgi:hypothetical protein
MPLIPIARSYIPKHITDRIQELTPLLDQNQREREALKRKLSELEEKLRTDAEREARQRNAAVAALVGGEPALDLPVVVSTTGLIATAKAEVEKRLRAAEEAEVDIRGQQRMLLAEGLKIAVKSAYRELVEHARVLEERFQVVLGLNAFARQYSSEIFNPMLAHQLYVPAFEQVEPVPKGKEMYLKPTLALGEDLHAVSIEVMRELERDLNALVGPRAAGFWQKPARPTFGTAERRPVR